MRYFTQSSAGWSGGEEVVYLFQANTAGLTGNLNDAEYYYALAHQRNPDYARARLGAAEIRYLRAASDCTPASIDRQGVIDAIAAYQDVLRAPHQPPLADIPTKVDLRVGRAYLCLAVAGEQGYRAAADAHFRKAIAAYDTGNARVQNMAADAYANLGLLALPLPGDAQALQQYRLALQHYERAITLSTDDRRKAIFYAQIGTIYARLGDQGAADRSFDEAVRLDSSSHDSFEAMRHAAQAKKPPADDIERSPDLTQ